MRLSSLLSFFVVASAIGCGSSTNVGDDAGGDGGTDETGGSCTPGSTDTPSCGKCGTSLRVCNSNGTWSDPSACANEKGICTPKETRSTACGGKCGVQTDVCSDTCGWTIGTCVEGACNAGDVDNSTDGCGVSEQKTRVCSASCAWGDYSACATVHCTPGATDTQACGKCGTHLRVCGSGGTWSDFSACSGETGVCAPNDTRTIACGSKCGSETDRCTASCTWSAGSCTEGACAPGSVDTTSTGCSDPSQVHSRTCTASCTWGDYTACAAQPCTPGTTDKRTCGKCGSQVRVCNGSTSTWSDWSTCAGETGACVPGEARNATCGACGLGSYPQVCSATCAWTANGTCTGEECAPFATDSTPTGCSAGAVRTRTCTSGCTWGPYGSCGGAVSSGWRSMAPSPLVGRVRHAAVWTGREMIVWGGQSSLATGATYDADGARYDPATDAWTKLPPAPIALAARSGHAMVWTGSAVLIFGGRNTSTLANGASFDPSTSTWSMLPAPPSGFAARDLDGQGVWSTTTQEMIVWGGGDAAGTTFYADGAAYKPATGTWRTIHATTLAARESFASVWTGSRMFVFGGKGAGTVGPFPPFGNPTDFADGGAYDPLADAWTLTGTPPGPPTFNGRELLGAARANASGTLVGVYGGYNQATTNTEQGDGAVWNDAANAWSPMPAPGASVLPNGPRDSMVAWYGAGRFWIWGGDDITNSGGDTLASGASFDASTGSWTPMSAAAAPAKRMLATVVWTGADAIVWGGAQSFTATTSLADGGRYRP